MATLSTLTDDVSLRGRCRWLRGSVVL